MDKLTEVVAFRNRLVPYMNRVLEYHGSGASMPASVRMELGQEQTWLATAYGRLGRVIYPSGRPVPMTMGYGSIITSHDVIGDAIHSPGDSYYADLARFADQVLMTRIGQLQGEAEERSGIDWDTFFRVTNPLYWLGRLAVLVRWVVTTKAGRIVGIMGVLALAAAQAFVSGWVQSVFFP